MSNISAVTATSASKPVLQKQAVTQQAQQSAIAAAQQEAIETADVTRQEAAKGDQVAIRKLAAQAAQHATHAPRSHKPEAANDRGRTEGAKNAKAAAPTSEQPTETASKSAFNASGHLDTQV